MEPACGGHEGIANRPAKPDRSASRGLRQEPLPPNPRPSLASPRFARQGVAGRDLGSVGHDLGRPVQGKRAYHLSGSLVTGDELAVVDAALDHSHLVARTGVADVLDLAPVLIRPEGRDVREL